MDNDCVLSKDDITALREAHTLVVFWRPDLSEGPMSGLRVSREVRLDSDTAPLQLRSINKAGVWTRTYIDDAKVDYSRTIEAGIPPQITVYEHDGTAGRRTARSAVWVATSVRYHASVLSVLRLIKAGDQIGVYFVGGNNNQMLNEGGLVKDEVYLRIKRKDVTVGEFMLDVSVTKDNSARIVQVA